jgi:lipoate-protein ligase A
VQSTPTSGSGADAFFDVDPWRPVTRRTVVVRHPSAPVLVLGSSQPATTVDVERARAAGVAVTRRRSGGGAVLVAPGDPVWIDVWLPRGDPLWDDDVIRAGAWLGRCWMSALGRLGVVDLTVHGGRSSGGPWSRVACFAGLGPGEVAARGRKLVGVAQWRSRQGALFHSVVYRRWQPAALVDLLALSPARRRDLAAVLGRCARGLADLSGPDAVGEGDDGVERAMIGSLPDVGSWSFGAP